MKKANPFLSFLKVGAIGFGGGSALIPVVEKEVVYDGSEITDSDYLKHTVIANITPGALPVKLGGTCGYQMQGTIGAVAGAYAVAIPGVVLTVLLLAMLSMLGGSVIEYFNYAAVGISSFIIFLLLSYVQKTVAGKQWKQNLMLCLGAFFVTCGKEVQLLTNAILGKELVLAHNTMLDISTIDLMILTFIGILLVGKLKAKWEIAAVLLLGLLYAVSTSKFAVSVGFGAWKYPLLLAMIAVCIAANLLRKSKGGTKAKIKIPKKIFITMGIFLLIPILILIIIMIAYPVPSNFGEFAGGVALSTVTSFGGGEAYVSVADGFFVQSGLVEASSYYNQLVPIANALPGPILVKLTAGLGYLYGAAAGSQIFGVLLAVAAASLAIGCCTAIAVLMSSIYDNVKDTAFIGNLKLYILPVICGMLLSTSCSMLVENIKITAAKGINNIAALLFMFLGIAAMYFLHKKFKLHDLYMLAGAAVVSFLLLM